MFDRTAILSSEQPSHYTNTQYFDVLSNLFVHCNSGLCHVVILLTVIVKDGGSAKAPLSLGRRSAQGLDSLRSGCKAGKEDCIEDKEGVHVLGVVK